MINKTHVSRWDGGGGPTLNVSSALLIGPPPKVCPRDEWWDTRRRAQPRQPQSPRRQSPLPQAVSLRRLGVMRFQRTRGSIPSRRTFLLVRGSFTIHGQPGAD